MTNTSRTITELSTSRVFAKTLTTASGLRVEISERLARSAEICRAIGRLSNLVATIPVWCDGEHIDILLQQEMHGRLETIVRGTATIVDNVWTVRDADDDVCDVFAAAVAQTT